MRYFNFFVAHTFCFLLFVVSYASFAVDENAKIHEFYLTADKDYLIVIEGAQTRFSVDVQYDGEESAHYQSVTYPFPFALFFVPKKNLSGQYAIRIFSQHEKTINIKVKKIAASDQLPSKTIKAVAKLTNAKDKEKLAQLALQINDAQLVEYVNAVVNHYTLLSPGGDIDSLTYYLPPNANADSVKFLRHIFFNVKLAEERKAYSISVKNLTLLMSYFVEHKYSVSTSLLRQFIKREVALIFADLEYQTFTKLMKASKKFCNANFLEEKDSKNQYDLMKQCFLDEFYLSWSEATYPNFLYVFIKGYWLYFNRVNEHENAIAFLSSRLTIHDTHLNRFEKAALLQFVGISYEYVGKLADARHAFHSAVKLLQDSPNLDKKALSTLSVSYFSLGMFYMDRGELQKAKLYIDKSLAMERQYGNKQSYYIPLYAAGKIARKLGDAKTAKDLHRQVSSNISPERYHYLAAQIEQVKNDIALEDFDTASKKLNTVCYSDNSPTLYEAQIIDCLILRAKTAVKTNDIAKAYQTITITYQCMAEKNCTKKSLVNLVESSNQPNLNPCNKKANAPITHTHYPARQIMLLDLDVKVNHDCPSYLHDIYKRAKLLIDKLAPEFLQAETFISATNRLFDSYISALFDNLHESNQELENAIFSALENYQNFNFAIRKVSSFRREIGQMQEQAFADIWQQKLNIREALLGGTVDKKRRHAMRLEEDMLSQKIRDLLVRQKEKVTAKRAIRLLDVIQSLPKGVAIAHIFSTHDKFYVVFSSAESALFYTVARTPQFDEKLAVFATNVNPQSLLPILRTFFVSHLFPKKTVDLNGVNKLVLVTDGALDVLPFSAFNAAESSEKYVPVAETLQIVNTISASHYFDDFKAEFEPGYDIAVFADPVFSAHNLNVSDLPPLQRSWLPHLPPLPYTRKEAQQVESIFNTKNVHLMLGREATTSALFKKPVRNAKILHIATHGLLDENYPDISAFATSKTVGSNTAVTDFLIIDELTQHAFNANLVLLSGCETAKGPYFNGVGINGLTQQFIQQGAGSVISALWKVDDRPTALFMQYFYLALKKHDGNTAMALFKAKKKFIRSGIYSHPKYWAGFQLTALNAHHEKIRL